MFLFVFCFVRSQCAPPWASLSDNIIYNSVLTLIGRLWPGPPLASHYSRYDRYSFFFSSVKPGLIMMVPPFVRFLRNCGSRECHVLRESWLSVRNSSKVDTVFGSHLTVPIRRHSWSVSKLMYNVQPLSPHGSFSAILRTSLAMRGRRSAGKRTSPQASCADLAALSSSSKRLARAWHAPPSSLSSLTRPLV